MDFHDPHPLVDLADLPSNAFESDFDFGQPRSDDYSSWPAESSPLPFGGEEEPEEEVIDGDAGEEADHEAEEDDEEEDSSEHEIEDDYVDQGEAEDDQEFGSEHADFEAEHENEFEYISDDDGGFHEVWRADVDWQSEPESEGGISDGGQRYMSEFLEDYENRRVDNILSDNSLFVDQAAPNLLPPIQNLIASVRQNHARALNLLHSELRRQDRALGRASAGPSRENHRQNHRHRPYDMPQERSRMADSRDHRSNNRFGDELVAVEMRAPSRRNQTPPRGQPEIIDLTGEPDSPEQPAVLLAASPRNRGARLNQASGRHPRRHLSLGQRTPSLSRSDGSLLGNNPNVIDLTLDDSSPAPPPLPQQLPRRENPDNNHHHHRQNHHHSHRRPLHQVPHIDLEAPERFAASRMIAGLVRSINHRVFGFGGDAPDVEVQLIGGRGLNMDPLGGNIPNLNYRGNGNNGGAVPKPDHDPPPPAREGFTRDTGSADDVVVCAGCEQELKYDPDPANYNAMSPRPPKKPRSRKDQEEHHFWALKECGHVYCKNCYESRSSRTTKHAPPSVFRRDKTNRKVLCKVDDCMTSDVNVKASWVGLFV
ncbi:hypothetical protein N657DRAFT_580225 [Parathielavia appendiculata]|uniref:Cell cycle control protein n=1 Tax=Parathielavia appendiculata TaxID=2587402 RepID=A0AAN6Z0E8_9PEZI|nr:hypothetical protein N657DRAFT_580225 [Parathielavia appendiculata]